MKRFFKAYRQLPVTVIFLLFGLTYIAVADTLTVTTAGTGSGNVYSAPDGIACASGSSANCSATFSNLSGITLTATSAWNSKQGVLTGGCSGIGECSFNIIGNTGVTVTFDQNYQALVLGHSMGPEYSTLTEAYLAAGDQGSVVANADYTFYENLLFNNPEGKFVRLYLGKEPGSLYISAPVGFTTLQGTLTIQYGATEIDALIIQ